MLLTNPKQHIIVPENYIAGLNEVEAELKTWGVSHRHVHTIFWKRDFLNGQEPVGNDEPDFNLVPQRDFPPPDDVDIACYKAFVKRFFGK